MKIKYYIDKNGDKRKVAKLNPSDKHKLREKNLKLLREAKLYKETVAYADYTVVDDSSPRTSSDKGD